MHTHLVRRLNSINKSQDYISKKLGIGRSTIWRLSKGKEISTSNLFKILTWLDNGVMPYMIIESKKESKYNIQSLDVINEKVCNYFKVDKMFPFQKTTKSKVVYIRQIFHYMAKITCNRRVFNDKAIAEYLKDEIKPLERTTVIHSHKTISAYLTYDKKVKNDVENILKTLPKINS